SFLVLDEPTSVLTPGEAQEVLGLVRDMTKAGDLTVLMISHKFHEVTAFADDVSVLRKGRLTGTGRVADLGHKAMAAMMIGDQPIAALDSRAAPKPDAEIVLKVRSLKAPDRTGLKSIR
ncbi:ABC transporter ATP-binding protein, partial [Mesorhizobium sp. M2D.F.Ca.ET.206.01.1.1]